MLPRSTFTRESTARSISSKPQGRLLLTETILDPARSEQAFALHRAACDWQLDRPIVICGEDDILSYGKIDVTPYAHQVKNLLTFCRLAPVALLADDVGLGKTISAGLILTELVHRRKVRKALVVCPGILLAQWERELTEKFRLQVKVAVGKELREALRADTGVIVTTYETARDHLDAVSYAGVQMLILDEAHRLRRLHGPGKPPLVASRIREGLAQRWFKFVLLLTATPIQNRVWDLYSLVDILTVAKGHKHPLGESKQFAKRYLKNQNALEIRHAQRADFRAHIRRYIARTRRADAKLPFPRREVKLHRVPASKNEQKLLRLLGRHLDRLEALQQVSLAKALMSSPEALVAELGNAVHKAPYLGECLIAAQEIVAVGLPSAKTLRLGVILEELRLARPEDFRLVIFTQRKETQRVIGEFLEKQGISHGFIRGGSVPKNREAIERFTRNPPDAHVLVSTDAGAEGVNLQAANVLVNYDLPWNPMVMEQRIGRIQRLGSKYGVVTIVNLVVADSVEERVVERLTKKLQLIGDTIGDIDAILESSGGSSKDGDDEVSFEVMIRKLVVAGLQDKDVESAVRLEERSIDEAKRLFDKNQAVIEEQLGRLDELHSSGPAAPELEFADPAMSLEDFVIRALEEDGAVVKRLDSGLIDVAPAKGRRFQAVLPADTDTGLPSGVIKYAPGEPAFEALVERWAAQDAALVYDCHAATDDDLRVLARQWCEQIPGAVLRDVRRVAARKAFQGIVDCEARTDVAHDGYEKVVSVGLCPAGHTTIPEDRTQGGPIGDVPQIESLFGGAREAIEKAVAEDANISRFCRFYEQRRGEELGRVERGGDAERHVRESFTPTVAARVIGLRGHRYEVVQVALVIGVDDKADYEAQLEFVPLTSQVVTEPERATCARSGRQVPAAWLDKCCESGNLVLRHMLEASESSGKQALPEYLSCSTLTGKRLLVSEMEPSAVSQKLAEPHLLVASEISSRRAFPSEIAACEFTQTKVLMDELVRSDVSSRMLRNDQQVASAVSGQRGHVSEFVKCELTDVDVLPEERVRSDLSQRWFRRDLLVRSEKPPHRGGARQETVKCARSGKVLLLNEVAASAASKRLVDLSLLVKSDASELRALPEELVVCALSGERVLPSETSTCVTTGKLAVRELMVKSAAAGSKSYMLPGREVRSSISKLPMAPTEAFYCPWLGVQVLPQEAGSCVKTGLRVANAALNQRGELDALRRVLESASQGQAAPDIVQWLSRTNFFQVRTPKAAFAITSPSGRLRAAVVRAEHWLWPTTHTGLIVEGSPSDGNLTMKWSDA